MANQTVTSINTGQNLSNGGGLLGQNQWVYPVNNQWVHPNIHPANVYGQHTIGSYVSPYVTPQEAMKRMICMRLSIPEGHVHPYEFLECCKLNDKEVAVFVVAGGEPIVIKDGTDLFPSDTLITQLRLLKK